jgi:phospholipid:diacylglycerol acyltransferase
MPGLTVIHGRVVRSLPPPPSQGTPLDELDLANTFLAHTHASHHERPATFFTTRRFLFPLGLALGSLVAYFLLAPLDPNAFDAYSHRLSTLVDDVKTQVGGLPSFPELNNLSGLPAQVWKDLAGLVDSDSYSFMKNRDFEVGSALAAEGLTADFPVILVPGIISTGLESWGTEPSQRPWFRKRLWGSTSMIQAVLSDKKEWMRALSLDEETGLDRKGYKVRAAQGFDAASQFIQGYWVWCVPIAPSLSCLPACELTSDSP